MLNEQLAAIENGETDASRQSDYQFELQDLAVSIELAKTSGSTLIDEATPPSTPYEPNTMRTATLAAVVGLLIGLGAAFLLDYLDTSVRDEDDLVRATGLPNLATIPHLPAKKTSGGEVPYLVTREHPHSPASEAFRSLQTAIKFLALERTLHTLLVTSPRPGEGKTTTATNLAISAAKSGQRVLLVDCDLRKPQAHVFFELPNDQGFTSVLLGEATMRQVAQLVPDAAKLAVITSGPVPPNASELLAGERTKASLEALSESVDLVIIDSPPVLPVSDPLILASLVDGVIVVASAGSTDRRQLSKTIERLAQVEAPVLGTVLNRYDPIDQTDYAYGYNAADGQPVRRVADQRPTPTGRRAFDRSRRHSDRSCCRAGARHDRGTQLVVTTLPALMPRKRADVMVADFDTELVVLVPDERQAHHLDVGLSLVLDSCDGATSTAAVVAEVALGTGTAVDAVESWLAETLATLERLNVLESLPL